MKARAIIAFFLAVASAQAADPLNLDKCGDINTYRVAPYLEVAFALQALPKEKAIAQLQIWADTKLPDWLDAWKRDDKIIILCRMLFEAKADSKFRRPMIGGPHFYGATTEEDWPLEPITLVDHIPLKIVHCYSFAAAPPESGAAYLKYCLENARWTSRHYQPATKEEIDAALRKLVNSHVWKKPLTQWELALIHEQALDYIPPLHRSERR